MSELLRGICQKVESVDPKTLPEKDFTYIDISAVDNSAKKISRAKVMPTSEAPSRARYLLKAGDVLVATTRPSLNAVALVEEEFEGAIGSTGFCVLRPTDQVTSAYLFQFVRSDRFVESLSDLVVGALYPAVGDKDVFSQKIPLPPLAEQKRIAAELDRRLALIGEAREAAERRLAAAALLESALFREVFGGATPVSIGAPMEKGASGPFAQPEPFPHPPQRAWKDPSPYRRLSEVARLESGHTPSRRRPEWWGGEIPWISLPDIRALDGKVVKETIRNTNPEGIANSSARILPKDTVVFGRDVQVGFTTITGRPMATSQHFFNWICGEGLNPRYLMHALRASKPYLQSMSSGAIHQTIYMPAARDFHLLLPDRKTQDTLAADLDERLAHVATILQSARAELEAIKALPAAALREIFG